MIGPSRRTYPLQGQIRACALAPNDSWNERYRPTDRAGVLCSCGTVLAKLLAGGLCATCELASFPCISLHHTTTHATDHDSFFLVRPSSDLSHESSLSSASRIESKMLILPRDPGDALARYQTSPLLNNRAPLLGLTITFVVRHPSSGCEVWTAPYT